MEELDEVECTKEREKDAMRRKLEDATKAFLASGGSITTVPIGATTLKSITEHEARRKMERMKKFGDE